MPTYKLHYFNLQGRGEIIRLVFAAAGVEYEEIQYEFKDWPTVKGNFPFGKLPCLEVNGDYLPESNTIARYLSNEFGLAGKTKWDKARVDMITDALVDVTEAIFRRFQEKDEKRKAILLEEIGTKLAPECFASLEKILGANRRGRGFFVGEAFTRADLYFINTVDAVTRHYPDILNSTPMLKSLYDRVRAAPKIAEYIENRANTII
ncbi:hematopoietic prostaglandin D synthase-like [Saccoglossus kowalevskii]|uniref:Hematopoietic prostaglandin D synthase-like n=1 Tax=Saccoglossus kowalevskii TaxID=10224 RepID=A0ABM0GJ12_SACKO|nr:PREDICTED: hematopoietic prostaglandin D synthase-like [Saccoglossus kowalevskii]